MFRSRSTRIVCAHLLWLALHGQTITTIAGTTRGFGGDGGPATASSLALASVQNACDPAVFEQGVQLAVDGRGNVFVADGDNHRIRRIAPGGNITTVAGTGERPAIDARCLPSGSAGDGGTALAARLYNPSGVAVHPNGDLIIADQQNNRIRRIDQAGVISTLAGNGMHNLYAPNIPATASPMDWPSAVAVDSNGVVYFSEVHSHRVAKIVDGRIVTIAGTGFPGYTGDGIPGTTATLRSPMGIAVDPAGNVYIADRGNHRIRRIGTDGMIATIAGTGTQGFSGDGGLATQAQLNTPMDVKVNRAGEVFITDTLNHRVRRIDTAGRISTVAGDGIPGRGDDNVAATASSLRAPAGVALDTAGDLYIADWQNFLIRRVSFSGGPAVSSGGIVNAASFTAGVLAPGTIFTIAGTNLANFTRSATEFPLGNNMDDISVEVNGEPVPLFFVSPTQINAQLPPSMPLGAAILRVRTATGLSSEHVLEVAETSPGIFQAGGAGRAAALNQDGTVNSSNNPEAAGRVVSVYLTGLGAVSPFVPAGAVTPASALSVAIAQVTATVSAVEAEVQYAGLAPGFVALAQVNVRIPPSAGPDEKAPLVIKAGAAASNTVTISIR